MKLIIFFSWVHGADAQTFNGEVVRTNHEFIIRQAPPRYIRRSGSAGLHHPGEARMRCPTGQAIVAGIACKRNDAWLASVSR
jgi:hypothetical protein